MTAGGTATRDVSQLTAKGRATRERIVTVASDLMLKRGVTGTTIEDVRLSAQVSASQMYHYFGNKQALVAAVIDHQTDSVLTTQYEGGLDDLDSVAALRRWRDHVVASIRVSNFVGGCPLGSLASDLAETGPAARAMLARSFDRWEALLRKGLTAMRDRGQLPAGADPDRYAVALLAAVQGVCCSARCGETPVHLRRRWIR